MPSPLTKINSWEELARRAEFKASALANLCHTSERQLQRFFNQRNGVPPRQWMRDMQFKLAADLISKGYTNKAVAKELSFASATHFCREFKVCFGTTPRDFYFEIMLRDKIPSLLDNNVASGSSFRL